MQKVIKYPIGIQNFEKIISEGYTYIDKTEVIHRLIDSGSFFFLSRPRRFGKSLTLSTLKAFFEGKKELFKDLAIYNLESKWTTHPVFHFSFARFTKVDQNSIEDLLDFHLRGWEEEYGIEKTSRNFTNRFATVIKKAVEITRQKAVVLVDEYDSALVSTVEDPDLHNHIKELLKSVFTVLKDLDNDIRFALITGITRFSKLTVFSGLNNLQDISMAPAYSTLCGITPSELERYFDVSIKKLGDYQRLSYEECLKKLKDYYDGYHFAAESEDIYNPFSILNVLSSGMFENYWFGSGIPSFIVERMKHQDLDLEKYLNQSTSGFVLSQADNAYTSDVALLFQAGFLTIKDFDYKYQEYKLGLPNREVRDGMSHLFMENFLLADSFKNRNVIRDLSIAIENGEPATFLNTLKAFFAGVPFDMSKGDKEVYFHNAFYIITNLIGLNVETERHTSGGSIDLVISTQKFVYVIEIKLNKKAQMAIEQIDSKEYALAWSTDHRKIFKIGVSFSSRTRNIREWIIKEG